MPTSNSSSLNNSYPNIPNKPLIVALLKLYAAHQGYFYINYFKNFKLIVSWLTEEPQEKYTYPQLVEYPIEWFEVSYELQELAIILKCSQGELIALLREIKKEKESNHE